MIEPTTRQLTILVAYIEAGGSRQAAMRLGLHPGTIRTILSDLQLVLNAANTAQAFAIAVRAGLIDPRALRLPEPA